MGARINEKNVNRKISLGCSFKQTKPFSWLELLNSTVTLFRKTPADGVRGIVQAVGEATWQTVEGGSSPPFITGTVSRDKFMKIRNKFKELGVTKLLRLVMLC
jgi:hypothetical protein